MPGPPKGYKMNEKQKATQFKPGQSGNPLGMPGARRRTQIANADKATLLRQKFLETLESRIATIEVLVDQDEDIPAEHKESEKMVRTMNLLNSDVNRLMVDSESRGYGTPRQSLELSGPSGGPIETINSEMTQEQALAAYEATLKNEQSAEDPDEE